MGAGARPQPGAAAPEYARSKLPAPARRAEATPRKADFEWNALHPVSSYCK